MVGAMPVYGASSRPWPSPLVGPGQPELKRSERRPIEKSVKQLDKGRLDSAAKAARKAGLKLDNSLLEVLIDLVGEDLHALSAELEKLALLAEDRGEPLTAEMLAEIVMAQGEVGKFELVDNLQPGNPGPALKIWFTQAAWGARAEEVAPILLWRIRKIALLAALMEDKIPDGDLASLAGLHPWVCKRLQESIRHLKSQGVARGLQASYRCDRALKRHSLRPEIALERAILEICAGP